MGINMFLPLSIYLRRRTETTLEVVTGRAAAGETSVDGELSSEHYDTFQMKRSNTENLSSNNS